MGDPNCIAELTEVRPWLDCSPLPFIEGLPDFGWRVQFDHKHHEPCRPFTLPRWHQMRGLYGLSFRYAIEWYNNYKNNKKMFIDNLDLCPWRPLYGAPVGGIGCGTIGRGYKGEFCRFQMVPGMYEYQVVEANQFTVCVRKRGTTVYQQVLSPNRPTGGSLKSWNWGFPECHGTYHALYPRSWTVYDLAGQDIRLICRQISPIVPHNYKDSSIPAAVFVWSIENLGHEEVEVSIMFTFQSGQGEATHRGENVLTNSFSSQPQAGQNLIKGVSIHQVFKEMPCVYAISAKQTEKTNVTSCLTFDPAGSGQEVWMDLMADGQLDCKGKDSSSGFLKGIGSAVCAQVKVGAKATEEVEFSLSWDMPLIHFGGRRAKYSRMYARWFGTEATASADLANYALHNYKKWEEDIEKWQNPILDNKKYPAWYKSAIFNEVYFVSDGGTIWVDPVDSDDRAPDLVKDYGKFAYLEGQEYRMYNTYDVHHDASFCLIMLWPKLQLSLQYDVAAVVLEENSEPIKYLMDGDVKARKASNCVPHDIGDPDDDTWINVNAYKIHPTQDWKDLNPKFILQYYRDYVHTGDRKFLEDIYPSAKEVMKYSLKWDTDGDGIIDNGGFADQTFDAWMMSGASAYCGGLWVAAVKVFCEAARLLGHEDDLQFFSAVLDKAKVSFETKLWNGKYYNFDSSKSDHFDTCMSGQLSGHLFLKSSDIPDDSVFPRDNVLKALQSIFDFNVMSFANGTMGAINGVRPNGDKDVTSCQSEEFWTGITYSVGALMLYEGLDDLGWQTAYGPYHVCYERFGLHFQTPEAYFEDQRYRSLGYLRPLAVWAIQYALERRNKTS